MERINVSGMEKAMGLKICQLCAVDFTLKHFLTPLIDGMHNKGWIVTSVCSDSGFVNELNKEGYKINVINISRSFNIYNHIKTFIKLVKFFRKEKFDILHVHTPVAGLIGRFAAKFCGIPFIIYTAHGFYFHDEMSILKKLFYIYLEKIGGSFTDLLFTQSKEDAVSAKKNKILLPEKVYAIGNGVSEDKFNPKNYKNKLNKKNYLNIAKGSFIFGIIGRLVKEKGYIEFLEAAVKINKKYKNTCFLVIGDRIKSDHNSSIEKFFVKAQKALGPRLIRIGYSNEVPELINIMDVFCLPSHREGMPRSIIEAMMMAKPIVATNIRGSREEVINNVTGLLVPTKDSDLLFKAFEKLILDKNLTLQFGKKGRIRALRYFSESRIIKNQLDIIEKKYSLKKRVLKINEKSF